jgi:hypothetical protein
MALEAHEEGATVLYGRCDEDLGVPYQPWVQALGHLVNQAAQPVLDAHVERFGGDLARLVPALRARVPDLPSPRESDPETERYLLYAAVAGLLQGAGEQEPLLLILDDLHWADAPTLSLLRHVVTSGSSMRMMAVGNCRDSDLSRDHPLTGLLAALHREQGVERIKLTGLDSGEVLALMEAAAGQELDENGRALAEEITRETAGNPFFAGEVLRHLTESGAIAQGEDGRWRLTGSLADLGLPQSVREVIGQRVERLGPEARTALSAAAVIGREFDLDLLLAVVDLPEPRLLDLIDEGIAASLLQENRSRAGRLTFTHGLVDHTLYEDLAATRRARLHKRIGEALEEQCGDEPGERLGELAGHWAAAIVSADTGKAIHYARRAAERALAQLAPDEAARWYRQALELFEQSPGGERSERCELLIGLGESQRQVGDPAFRQTLLDAAGLAQEISDADRLCRAVLANSRGWTSQIAAVDPERVQALEAAAEVLPDRDARRARVLALLGVELVYAGEPARCRLLASEAIETARAAADPSALADVLNYAIWAIWVPDTLQERKPLVRELIELAQRLGDLRLSFIAAAREVMIGAETADRSEVKSGLATMRRLAASTPEPTLVYLGLIHEAGWAIAEGDLQAAERLARNAFDVGRASGQPDAVQTLGAQMFPVREAQGRLGELADGSVQLAVSDDNRSAWRAAAALALVDDGRADEARELVLGEDLPSIPADPGWSIAMLLWAQVYAVLGDGERAGGLYELLEPYSGQVIVSGPMVYGAIDWALGMLAGTVEHYEEADRHFVACAEIDERLGAPLFLARTRVGHARTLIARGRTEDFDPARQMLEQAEDTATRLAAGLITREVAECRAELAAVSR